ncbi:hypothetical protein GQ43DRAFT_442057 [Delitschia confertaspora ATCC 74209]|uniref:Uncharacterized protein n=1 Tax=Delitschia confertaspora ATCC 74209 TaxID=1513339 RepID=A0A9P4JIQ2_9PLEO|nr:hypothetical protein GQ43DRAFT_442057 [Delitschia confertaspora ATCC 74209]
MEGAERDTSEERLEKIRKAIPDAKAIIPHPRAPNKVSVVVRDEKGGTRLFKLDCKE